jgi:hypothetical protein
MRRSLKGLLAAAIIAAPVIAHADSITYDFTGIVTNSGGDYSSVAIGSLISGTLTLNFANADGDSTRNYGVVGSTASGWSVGTIGNPPAAMVVSSTANVDGISYVSQAPIGNSYSFIEGSGGTGAYFQAGEYVNTLSQPNTESSIELYGSGSASAYSSAGLPINVGGGTGFFAIVTNGINSEVVYNISSLSPVPLPASVWLMLSGLVGVGAMARKRRAA